MSKSASTKFCIACHESIHAEAVLCRYCRSEQQPNSWGFVAQVLKWIGGITAVISLVLGTLQINDLFGDWQERKIAVSQLIDAAALQTDSSDYKGAWQLVDEALSLNPSSLSARQQQMIIAMAWLRNIRVQGNETFSDIVDQLLPTLYLGSVNENGNIAANAFAHIGWANYLRMNEGVGGLEIEEYFRRALNIDADNLYAHAMWGYWKLSPRNERPDSDTDVEIAKSHFSSALASDQDREFVRALQLSALQQALHGSITQIELIKVAHEIMQQKGTLSQRNRAGIFKAMQDIIAPHNMTDQSVQAMINQLTEQRSPTTILALFEWLDYNKDSLSGIMIYARLHELNGNSERALSYYQTLISSPSASTSSREFAQQAIDRLTGFVGTAVQE